MRPGQLQRLEQELREVELLLSESSLLDIKPRGVPPTGYTVFARCGGLVLNETGEPWVIYDHRFQITLPARFPHVPPVVSWETPIWHPNINPPDVCLGDHWFGASTIAEICERLCEMVQLKSFNLYDPLNPEVAHWFRDHMHDDGFVLPVDDRPIRDLRFPFAVQSSGTGTAPVEGP